jgi:monoamine oxidase
MGSSIKFHAVYARPFWRADGSNGQALSAAHAVCLTYDNSPAGSGGRGVLVGLVVADQAQRLSELGQPRQHERILSDLCELFGPQAMEPEALVIHDWNREQWTRGCYAANFPAGVWTTSGSAFREPAGRIHWAGTETATAWHGYMEGALRSGRRVAAEMLGTERRRGGAL